MGVVKNNRLVNINHGVFLVVEFVLRDGWSHHKLLTSKEGLRTSVRAVKTKSTESSDYADVILTPRNEELGNRCLGRNCCYICGPRYTYRCCSASTTLSARGFSFICCPLFIYMMPTSPKRALLKGVGKNETGTNSVAQWKTAQVCATYKAQAQDEKKEQIYPMELQNILWWKKSSDFQIDRLVNKVSMGVRYSKDSCLELLCTPVSWLAAEL